MLNGDRMRVHYTSHGQVVCTQYMTNKMLCISKEVHLNEFDIKFEEGNSFFTSKIVIILLAEMFPSVAY